MHVNQRSGRGFHSQEMSLVDKELPGAGGEARPDAPSQPETPAPPRPHLDHGLPA